MNERTFSIDIRKSDEVSSEIAEHIRRRWSAEFALALIAGSGVHEALEHTSCVERIDYADIQAMPQSKVLGHMNRLEWRKIAGLDVLVFSGRFHRYEANTLQNSILPVSISATLHIPAMLITNAAGGLNPNFRASHLMLCEDLLNFSFASVHKTSQDQLPARAHSRSSSLIDREWLETLYSKLAANEWLHRGTYASVSGPSYETRAEIRMFSRFADAIGMSTIHEAQAAVHYGMRVLALSIITNEAKADQQQIVQHSEVVENARIAAAHMAECIERSCETLKTLHAR